MHAYMILLPLLITEMLQEITTPPWKPENNIYLKHEGVHFLPDVFVSEWLAFLIFMAFLIFTV